MWHFVHTPHPLNFKYYLNGPSSFIPIKGRRRSRKGVQILFDCQRKCRWVPELLNTRYILWKCQMSFSLNLSRHCQTLQLARLLKLVNKKGRQKFSISKIIFIPKICFEINYILPVFFVSSMLSFKTDSEELQIIRENGNSKDKIIFIITS